MRFFSLALILILGIINLTAVETTTTSTHIERYIRPDPADKPTPIQQSLYVVDILEINDVERTITLDYVWLQMWNDPRLANANYKGSRSKLDLSIDDIWNPHLARVNLKGSAMLDAILNIDENGNVAYRQRLIDTYTAPLNLRRFPFDKQSLSLKFLSTLYGPDEIELQWNEDRSGHLDSFSLPGWTFEGSKSKIYVQDLRNIDRKLQGFDLHLKLNRQSGFYVWKVFVPLSFIVFMAWTVFWIDPANFPGQIAISTSSVITLIAFQLSLTELLPKISYLTEVDLFALATSFLVFIALGEAILTARLAKIGKHAVSLSLDKWMRIIYPIVFAVLILFIIF